MQLLPLCLPGVTPEILQSNAAQSSSALAVRDGLSSFKARHHWRYQARRSVQKAYNAKQHYSELRALIIGLGVLHRHCVADSRLLSTGLCTSRPMQRDGQT